MTALRVEYNSSNIAITVGIAFIGIFAGVSLCEQFRLATLASSSYHRYFILFLVACAIGWSCTWCMHSGSISSIRLYNGDELVPIRFNSSILALAAILSVIQTFIGLCICSTDDCFNNTRAEIMEKFIARASTTYSIDQLKKMNNLKILFIVCTHSLTRINIGGLFSGASIAAMHYLILHSIEFQGRIEHNIGIVVAAFLFGMINGTGGFWAFFRLLSIFPSIDMLRIVVTCIGVITVCGMNYIGLASVQFYYENDSKKVPPAGDTISPEKLYNIAIIGSLFFVIIMFMLVLHDLRRWLLRTSTQLRQADRALLAVMKRSEGAAAAGGNRSARIPTEALHYNVKFLHRHSSSAGTLACDAFSGKSLGPNSTAAAPAYTTSTTAVRSGSCRSTVVSLPYHGVAMERGVVNRNAAGRSSGGSYLHALFTDYNDEEDATTENSARTAPGARVSVRGAILIGESRNNAENMHENFHSIEETNRDVGAVSLAMEHQYPQYQPQQLEEELDDSSDVVHKIGVLEQEISSRKYFHAVSRLQDDIEEGMQSVSKRWTQSRLEEQKGCAYSNHSNDDKEQQEGDVEMESWQKRLRIPSRSQSHHLPANTTPTTTATNVTAVVGTIVRALSGKESSSSKKVSPVR